MPHLIKGKDAGGLRYFLADQPVHAGDGLEVLLPGGAWVRVRFELDRDGPVLHLNAGGAWEHWEPPLGKREGDEVEVPCKDCGGRGHVEPGDACQHCHGTGQRVTIVRGDGSAGSRPCNECEGTGRVQRRRNCWNCEGHGTTYKEIRRPYAPGLVLRGEHSVDLKNVELRWPARRTP